MSGIVDPLLAEFVWFGTATLRRRAHVAAGQPACPTRDAPYSSTIAMVHQLCRDSDCLGIMHDVYARVLRRLEKLGKSLEMIAERPGYVRRIVESQVADCEREARVRRGLPAKPTRNDGAAGRVNEALDECTEAGWLKTLFRMMRGYACRDGRASSAWPVDAWCNEKSSHDGVLRGIGTTTARAELMSDIQAVIQTAGRVAGKPWVNDQILHPLQTCLVPLDDAYDRASSQQAQHADVVAVSDLRQRFRRLTLAGMPSDAALRQSALEVLGAEPQCAIGDVLDDLLIPALVQAQPMP
ncbi:hypothetical protein E1263_10415 [Kribbella antibiotica]|uniref:Uncharacterized protein n=1 Tax=Kribbella antibiotica TaxID=190195 RepID=A0A4R4ZQR6_9ACTN|nr:hypothetical protein [Kribbella antibiotica]TDD60680.1 hypothetical protein E1263_10415 [Kribbella antibiotica]